MGALPDDINCSLYYYGHKRVIQLKASLGAMFLRRRERYSAGPYAGFSKVGFRFFGFLATPP